MGCDRVGFCAHCEKVGGVMSSNNTDWLDSGEGLSPEQTWAFSTEAPLADVQYARETGDTLAADVLGGLYWLNRQGRIQSVNRGFKFLSASAFCDTANFGAAVLGTEQLCRFDRQLQRTWTTRLPGKILAVGIDPFGHHIAVALDSSETILFGQDNQRVCEFASIRPLHFLRFVGMDRHVIGAANYGVLQRQQTNGEPVWDVQVLSTVGDLAITGDGRYSYLAAFSHGVQVYDNEGNNHASYMVKGSPARISTSFDGAMIMVATQENYLYRMNPKGELLWAAEAPDAITRLHCDPLGTGFLCGFASGRIARFDWPS